MATFSNPLSYEFKNAFTSASKGKGIFKRQVTDGCTAAESTFTATLPGEGALPQGKGPVVPPASGSQTGNPLPRHARHRKGSSGPSEQGPKSNEPSGSAALRVGRTVVLSQVATDLSPVKGNQVVQGVPEAGQPSALHHGDLMPRAVLRAVDGGA